MKDKKNLGILALLLIMVIMSYGFVSYSNKAIEESHANVVKKWDVAITNVETIITGEAEAGNVEYSEGTLRVRPTLKNFDDSVEYRVTITNNGLIDAKLSDSIYTIKDPNSSVVFTYDKEQKIINSKETITLTIKATVDKEKFYEPEIITNELVALYNYIQK